MQFSRLSYTERAKSCTSSIAKQLLELLDSKKTNLALSADVTSAEELLYIADQLGPTICLLKTHIDIIQDFTRALTIELKKLAAKHHFFLFEDRKFADIGNTVKHQYTGGIYRIADWAHFINAHSLPGPGIIQGLADASHDKQRGLILLAEMSSKGHLMDDRYIQATLHLAKQFPDFVMGFITQRALSSDPRWVYLTPGVQLTTGQDTLGQQYITPEKAIEEQGTDIIIVGRGILSSSRPLETANLYRERAFIAYERRLINPAQAIPA